MNYQSDLDSSPFAAVQPPKIVKPIKDTVAPNNGPGKFACKVTGFPTPEVTWYLGDTPLTASENLEFEVDEKANMYHMTLLNDLSEMAGQIKVLAVNKGGEDSCVATLDVRGRAPTFIERPLKVSSLLVLLWIVILHIE